MSLLSNKNITTTPPLVAKQDPVSSIKVNKRKIHAIDETTKKISNMQDSMNSGNSSLLYSIIGNFVCFPLAIFGSGSARSHLGKANDASKDLENLIVKNPWLQEHIPVKS